MPWKVWPLQGKSCIPHNESRWIYYIPLWGLGTCLAIGISEYIRAHWLKRHRTELHNLWLRSPGKQLVNRTWRAFSFCNLNCAGCLFRRESGSWWSFDCRINKGPSTFLINLVSSLVPNMSLNVPHFWQDNIRRPSLPWDSAWQYSPSQLGQFQTSLGRNTGRSPPNKVASKLRGQTRSTNANDRTSGGGGRGASQVWRRQHSLDTVRVRGNGLVDGYDIHLLHALSAEGTTEEEADRRQARGVAVARQVHNSVFPLFSKRARHPCWIVWLWQKTVGEKDMEICGHTAGTLRSTYWARE